VIIRKTIKKTMKEDELLKGLAAPQLEDSISARVKYLHQNITQHFQPNESSLSIRDENIHDYIMESSSGGQKDWKDGFQW
jgi:hypothetical protein